MGLSQTDNGLSTKVRKKHIYTRSHITLTAMMTQEWLQNLTVAVKNIYIVVAKALVAKRSNVLYKK